MSLSQKDTILQLLNAAEWVCGGDLRDAKVQEYRSRINELRKKGFSIINRRCTQHHHTGIMQEWQLVAKNSPPADQTTVQTESTSTGQNIAPQPRYKIDYEEVESAAKRVRQIEAEELSQQPKYGRSYSVQCCEIWERSKYMHAIKCVNAQN